MRAAILHEPQTRLDIQEVDLLPPQPGEVLVRVHASGICHSDLHYIKGDARHPLPVVLGHEGAGVVESVGRGVTRVQPGDHVIFVFRAFCGQCYYCLRGRPTHCEINTRIRATGRLLDGTSRLRWNGREVTQLAGIGCFAERAVVVEQSLVRIPPDIPLDRAALVGCGVTTGVGAALFTAHVAPGENVLIIGGGGVGLSAVQGARLAGAHPIIVADIVPRKLEWARELGATHTIDAGKEDVVEHTRALTGGRGADYALECIGLVDTMRQAYAAARRGGTLVIVGLAPSAAELCLSPAEMLRDEKTVKASLFGSADLRKDLLMLLELYRDGRLRLDEMITQRFPLERINEAYEALERGELLRGVVIFA